jgi:hypothetical protein
MIKAIKIKFKGIEPILYIITQEGNNKGTYSYSLFYPYRKLKWKIQCKQIKKKIMRLGYIPLKCQRCGEGWAEYSIEEPNEEYGTHKRINACVGCVTFYDWKNTKKSLYIEITDFRG